MIVIIALVSVFIAFSLGRRRRIGFWWSFALNFTLPIVGLVITLISKYPDTEQRKSSVWLTLLGGFLSIAMFKTTIDIFSQHIHKYGLNFDYATNMPPVGLLVIFMYIFSLGFASKNIDNNDGYKTQQSQS